MININQIQIKFQVLDEYCFSDLISNMIQMMRINNILNILD